MRSFDTSIRRRPIGSHASPADRRPFSRGVSVDLGNADLIFISGMASTDDRGDVAHVGDVRGQTRRVFERMRSLLGTEGASLSDVVKLTIFLKDIADYPAMNEVRSEYFASDPPASSAVQATMIHPEFLVEIEAIAIRPKGDPNGVKQE